MIKSYVYVNGDVVAKGEKEIEKVVPYYDNIGARFVVQNEIEFLLTSLKNDEKKYNDKILSRASSWTSYKIIAPITGALSVAAPFAFSLVTFIGRHAEYVSTPFGNLDPYIGTVVTALPVTIIVGQMLAGLQLVFRPSKSEIAGSYEMVQYERETLENKQNELEKLEQDDRKENEPKCNNSTVIKVDDSKQIKRHKENLILRYEFGARKDKIYNMFKNGTLWETMKNQGFLEESMTDYMIFVEQEFTKNEQEDLYLKKIN